MAHHEASVSSVSNWTGSCGVSAMSVITCIIVIIILLWKGLGGGGTAMLTVP